jgi:nitroreductase
VWTVAGTSADMSDTRHPKIAQTDHEILDVIRHRWSPRAFDPSREVSRADLERLFEAARWAPSSFNEQPWRFVIVDRVRTPDAFAPLLGALLPRNQAWAGAAPVLVLVAVRVKLERNDMDNAHAWYDAGQAVAFLTLQATAAGLSIRQMQGFDPEVAREVCRVPAPFEPAVIMAVGHAGDPEALATPAHRDAERAPRIRRAIAETVFEGSWGISWAAGLGNE